MDILKISGSAFEIGEYLGKRGKKAWHTKVKNTDLWQKVSIFKNSETITRMQSLVEIHFPEIWQEILGISHGLEEDTINVFLWNCRGDLLASTSDGCTTISGKDQQGNIIVAHNEDGLPSLLDDCFLVDAYQESGKSFFSFAYPASLCGHTFSINSAGIINTVNNLRLENRPIGFPRQVLARASLNANDIETAKNILLISPRAGGFHHTLAQFQNNTSRIISIEAIGEHNLIREIDGIGCHANHIIYTNTVKQIITESSRARQAQLDLLSADYRILTEDLCLNILSNKQNSIFPIYRQAKDDPDQENTIATIIFQLQPNKVCWKIFRENRVEAENIGEAILKTDLSV